MLKRLRTSTIRRGAVLLVLAGVAWWFHAPLLRGLAQALVLQQPVEEFDVIALSPDEHGLSCDGDHGFDVTAELLRQNPARKVLLLRPRPNRCVQMGIVPTFETVCRRELEKRGVPRTAVEVTPEEGRSPRQRRLAEEHWLRDHPQARMLAICDVLGSAAARRSLDQYMPSDLAARVFVRGLPRRDWDPATWWHSRAQARLLMFAWLNVIYARLRGDADPPLPEWTVEEYDGWVQERIRRAHL